MRRISFTFVTIIGGASLVGYGAGCASLQKTATLELSAAATTEANRIAENWESFVHARIKECREKLGEPSTPEQREQCLGRAAKGDELEAGFAALVAAQTAVWLAARCDLKTPLMPEVPKCEDVDWPAVFKNLESAWRSLAPFAWDMAEELR